MSAGAAALTAFSTEQKPQLTRLLRGLTRLIASSLNAHDASRQAGDWVHQHAAGWRAEAL